MGRTATFERVVRLVHPGSTTVDGARKDYVVKKASGVHCNCLIDTIRQVLPEALMVNPHSGVESIREALSLEFPSGVDRVISPRTAPANYLDLQVHWRSIVRLLGQHANPRAVSLNPDNYMLVCVDLDDPSGLSTTAGEGPIILHIAREHRNHFVPLRRLHDPAPLPYDWHGRRRP